jgi:PAS domain S-box-containing protein
MTDAVVNILLLEDEPAHAEAIRRALEASDLKAVLHVAGTLREYREAVAARPPDIALLDLVLPDGRALDVLTSLPHGRPFPILIITSYGNEQTAVEAMKAGALDYIVKSPEAFATMPHAVERALREWNALQERKRAEEARRESEERFRILFESSHDAIMTLEPPSWNFTSGNPAALAMFRAKNVQEFISFGLGILSPERQPDGGASADKAQKMIEAAMRDGSRLFEWTHARTDGTEFPATVLLTRMEQDGKVFLQATVRDITEQKREDEALRESEERFRFIFDSAIDGMLLVSLENQKINSANRSMSQMLGYSLEELKKLGTADIHPKEELPYVKEQIDIQSKDGLAPARDLPMRRKDGSVFYANVRGAQIILSGKKYLMGVFRDITERKQAEERLHETLQRLRLAITSTVRVIGMMVEARDPYTAGHQQKTTILAEAIAVELGLSPERIEGLRMAGQVHDVGKISVPAELLSKPTRLTPGEFKLVKTHAQKGYEILKDVEFPWPLAEIVYQHHERRDGSGYPRGLKGDEILMEARILAVSDTMEAMSSNRPYRPAPGLGVALEEIDKNKGVLFDPDVAAACLKLFKEKGFRFED